MPHSMDEYFQSPNGALFRFFPEAEFREGQQRMAEIIADAIQDGAAQRQAWLDTNTDRPPQAIIQPIEAGTGVGKSLGYLIPALASGARPVIVSTRTKNLQQQLFTDDLPRASNILQKPIKAVVAKGRSNYLCVRAYDELKKNPDFEFSPNERALWLTMDRWVATTEHGDGDELAHNDQGHSVLWETINARNERCTGRQCADYDRCFLTRLQEEVSKADVVIVNHALLLADRQLRESDFGQILPDAPVLIVDEAHELADQLTDSCSEGESTRTMELLWNDLEATLTKEEEVNQIPLLLPSWKLGWAHLQNECPPENGMYSLSDPKVNRQNLQVALQPWLEHGSAIGRECQRLAMREPRTLMWEKLADRIQNAVHRLEYFSTEPEGWISTIQRESKTFVRYQSNPISVAEFFDKHFRQGFETVILTSATLSGGASFGNLGRSLGLRRQEYEAGTAVPSPFNFASQTRLFVPPQLVERKASATQMGSPKWLEQCRDAMERLCRASRGRAMILFTSKKMLEYFQPLLVEGLPGLTVMSQGGALNRTALLAQFKRTPHAVLLGLASFWQGVDLPGDEVVLVIVTSLPFAPPDDPLLRARVQKIDEEESGGGFMEVQLPLMSLKLKQGMGRLIRTQNDRGVVVVLDPRILTPEEDPAGKSYARALRASLPPFPLTRSWDDVEDFLKHL